MELTSILSSNEERADTMYDSPNSHQRIQSSAIWKDVIVLKLIVTTSIMFSLFFYESLMERRSYPVSNTSIHVPILVITSLGLISMVTMICLKNNSDHFTIKPILDYHGRHYGNRSLAVNFKTVVFVVFAIATLCYYVVNIIYHFYCITGESPIKLPVYFLSVLFCIVQQYFCIKIKGLKCKSFLIRCLVTFVLEVNISICLGILVRETVDVWKETSAGTNQTLIDKNESSFKSSSLMCFNQSIANIQISNNIERVFPYLYPLVIEHSVMAMQNLFDILAFSLNKQMDVSVQNTLSMRQENERTPLLRKERLTRGPIAHDTVKRRKCKCRRSFLLGLLVGTPVAVITFTNCYAPNVIEQWISTIIDTIFIVLLIIACVIGLVRSFRKRDERDVQQSVSFGAGDVIYFIAVSSASIYHALALTASIALLNSPISTSKTDIHFGLVLEIFVFVSLLLQTIFLRNCTTARNSADANGELVNEVLTFVAVYNTVLWLVNSFYPIYILANQNYIDAKYAELYGVHIWIFAFKITVPLAIYYRFHSVLLCLESLSESKRCQ